MNKIEPIRETHSLCPVCRKRIPALLVEDGGSIFMEKTCPEHGPFRPLIAKYAHYYRDLARLYGLLRKHFPSRSTAVESCAFTATLDCNMNCPICFAGDEGRIMPPEMPLAEVEEKLIPIRGDGIMFKLHGGEPTLRKDLPEIIRRVRKSGNYPVLVTNALKLDDFDYFNTLKESGLYAIAPSFDARHDDTIYEKMRGRPLAGLREELLKNARRLGLKIMVFFVALRGVNDDQLPAILRMTREYPEIYKIIVLAYMHRGCRGFSEENEYTADETWDLVVDASDVFLDRDELYISLKINIIARALRNRYQCFNSQTVLMPRQGNRESGFDPDHWRRVIERFEELLGTNPGRARRYFLRKLGMDLLGKGFFKPMTNRLVLRKKELADTFIPPSYYWLQFQTMYYPKNYDEEMVKEFCPFLSFNPGLEKRVSFCEYYNLYLKT
ncbi:MAG: radical SAM protein [Candidatus Auribacterota bacterium]|nr:radical SAM protein [Candidatus Auribacterota bacterium]